jgi:hypothetical protein
MTTLLQNSSQSLSSHRHLVDFHQIFSTMSSVFGIIAGLSALGGVLLLGAFINDQQLEIATTEAWLASSLISLVSCIILIILGVINYLPIIYLGDLLAGEHQQQQSNQQAGDRRAISEVAELLALYGPAISICCSIALYLFNEDVGSTANIFLIMMSLSVPASIIWIFGRDRKLRRLGYFFQISLYTSLWSAFECLIFFGLVKQGLIPKSDYIGVQLCLIIVSQLALLLAITIRWSLNAALISSFFIVLFLLFYGIGLAGVTRLTVRTLGVGAYNSGIPSFLRMAGVHPDA